jgi:hypothetical protein
MEVLPWFAMGNSFSSWTAWSESDDAQGLACSRSALAEEGSETDSVRPTATFPMASNVIVTPSMSSEENMDPEEEASVGRVLVVSPCRRLPSIIWLRLDGIDLIRMAAAAELSSELDDEEDFSSTVSQRMLLLLSTTVRATTLWTHQNVKARRIWPASPSESFVVICQWKTIHLWRGVVEIIICR